MELEIRTVVALGEMMMEEDVGAFWDIGYIVFTGLGVSHTGWFLQLK